MQPKRDPEDVRYWPRKEGGNGFPRSNTRSRQFSALRTYDQHGNLTHDAQTDVSIVTAQPVTSRQYEPETVRSRARAVLMLAISRVSDTLSDEANELKLNELAPTMAALGRISGVAVEEQKTGDIRIHIVRDQPQLPEQTTPHALHEVAPAKDIGTHDLPLLASPDTSPSSATSLPHAPREVSDVSACDAIGYDDDA